MAKQYEGVREFTAHPFSFDLGDYAFEGIQTGAALVDGDMVREIGSAADEIEITEKMIVRWFPHTRTPRSLYLPDTDTAHDVLAQRHEHYEYLKSVDNLQIAPHADFIAPLPPCTYSDMLGIYTVVPLLEHRALTTPSDARRIYKTLSEYVNWTTEKRKPRWLTDIVKLAQWAEVNSIPTLMDIEPYMPKRYDDNGVENSIAGLFVYMELANVSAFASSVE